MTTAPIFEWYPSPCQRADCGERHLNYQDENRFHNGNYVRIGRISDNSISVQLIQIGRDLSRSSFRYITGYFRSISYSMQVIDERGDKRLAEWYRGLILPLILQDAINLQEISSGL